MKMASRSRRNVAKASGNHSVLYSAGMKRTEIRENTSGGERLFKGTRLSVRNVAEMLEAGDTVEMILEDYPYLARDDVEFARLYHRASAPVGRGSSDKTGSEK
jgi:uncharacterized protein (DUF433 family)